MILQTLFTPRVLRPFVTTIYPTKNAARGSWFGGAAGSCFQGFFAKPLIIGLKPRLSSLINYMVPIIS